MRKLYLSLIAVVLLSTIGLGWAITLYYQHQMSDQNAEGSDEFAPYEILGYAIAHDLDLTQSEDEARAYIQRKMADDDRLRLQLSARDDFPLPASLEEAFIAGQPLVLESDGYVDLHFFISQHDLILTVSTEDMMSPESDESLNVVLTLVFYIGLVVLILLWLWPLVSRLKHLNSVARLFGAGDFDARVRLNSSSYIGHIEREFNRMADRIQTLVNDNKLLSRAVSHDLKTPLARLRFGIEALEECGNEGTRKKYHNHIQKDLDEMESLVNTLLAYARLDEASIKMEREPVDLAAVIEVFLAADYANSSSIDFHSEDETILIGDKTYLKMLVQNVVSNAVRYGGGKVKITLNGGAPGLMFCVEDDGPGFSDGEEAQVVQPFFRGKAVGEKAGYGMGLAIVKRIAEWHGGEVEISNSVDIGGAKVKVTFLS